MIKYLWQLPQNLLCLIVLIFIKNTKKEKFKDVWLYKTSSNIGVSLGSYIILNEKSSNKSVCHEYGHCKQSQLLGPIYLIVVGLPSIIMNILTRMFHSLLPSYYKRWPENWADKLGNVDR